VKEPILRNNFDSESAPGENGPENGAISTGTPPVSGADLPPEAIPLSSQGPALERSEGRGQGRGPSATLHPTPSTPRQSLPSSEAKGDAPKARRGPKTERGKRAVSRNAIKHAIFSPNPVVIAGLETIEEWEEFQAEIAESWGPAGRYERELAYDVAFGFRRLHRCRIYEAALLSSQVQEIERALIEEANDDDDDDDDDEFDDDDSGQPDEDQDEGPSRPLRPVDPARLRAHKLREVIPDGFSIDRLLRYETHARRALLQSVHELEATQARRRGEQAHLARVDFNAGPSLKPPSARGSSAYEELNQRLARTRHDLAQPRRHRRQPARPPAEDE